VRHRARPPISFGGIGLFSMEDCAPSTFLRSWVLVGPYLCFKFSIDPFWKSVFFKLRGAHTYFNHAYVQRKMAFLM